MWGRQWENKKGENTKRTKEKYKKKREGGKERREANTSKSSLVCSLLFSFSFLLFSNVFAFGFLLMKFRYMMVVVVVDLIVF